MATYVANLSLGVYLHTYSTYTRTWIFKASASSANPPEMLKDELFDKTIEMNSSRSSGDITILEEHLNDDVTIIGERGGRRSKRSADLAEIKSAQTQKKVKVLLLHIHEDLSIFMY